MSLRAPSRSVSIRSKGMSAADSLFISASMASTAEMPGKPGISMS